MVTGGTDSHLLLIDLRNKNLLGNTVAEALEAVGIVLNRNAVPFDTNPPFYPSGIRLGTPGITSRGMKEAQMKIIAKAMGDTVDAIWKTKEKMKITSQQEKDKKVRKNLIVHTPELKQIKRKISQLCKKFPLKKVY
jgi:glycine/serine hydroxymethyltransferase